MQFMSIMISIAYIIVVSRIHYSFTKCILPFLFLPLWLLYSPDMTWWNKSTTMEWHWLINALKMLPLQVLFLYFQHLLDLKKKQAIYILCRSPLPETLKTWISSIELIYKGILFFLNSYYHTIASLVNMLIHAPILVESPWVKEKYQNV